MGILNLFNNPGVKPEADTTPKITILVAEDDQYIRDFYQELLTEKGYQIITAANGQESLNLASQKLPQLILLDIMMPVMDGNEVLSKLWDNELTRKIPVIVLTNAGNIENMDKAKFYNAFKFMIKSNVAPEEILKTVEEALQQNK